MKKVLFLLPSISTGGAEKVASRLGNFMSKKGYSITMLTFFNAEKEYFLNESIVKMCISNGNETEYKKMNMFKKLHRIRKKIKQVDPDRIICFLDYVCIYGFISVLFSKYVKRIIFTERNNPRFASKKVKTIKNILQKFVSKIIVQNKGQQALLSKRDQRKSVIISNPIDYKYFAYKKELSVLPKRIISIGRLTDQKDYPLAIESFSNVIKKYPYMTYHIYGKGDCECEIRKMINKYNLDGKVFLKGFTTNINDIYDESDIFLMTSKYEGMPNSLAETLAVGLPCICSDCDFGPSDLITNEKMGILVKEHTLEAFEEAIIYMIENYSFFASYSNYTKTTMKEKYSLEIITDKWLKNIF